MPGSIPVQRVLWSEVKTRFKYSVGILVEGHWCDYSIACEECSSTYQSVEVPLRILLHLRANLFSLWLIVDYVWEQCICLRIGRSWCHRLAITLIWQKKSSTEWDCVERFLWHECGPCGVLNISDVTHVSIIADEHVFLCKYSCCWNVKSRYDVGKSILLNLQHWMAVCNPTWCARNIILLDVMALKHEVDVGVELGKLRRKRRRTIILLDQPRNITSYQLSRLSDGTG
jgi:hypothetical protein